MFSNTQAAGQPKMPAMPAREVAVRIELTRPLPAHHGDVHVIELRQPEFADWIECGDMYVTEVVDPRGVQRGDGGAARVTVKPEVVALWMSRLSGLPTATLGKLPMADARAVFKEVTRLVSTLDAGN